MEQIQYRVIRSDRRTMALQITPAGELVVRCNHRTSQAAISAFLKSKATWIAKHLTATRAVSAEPTLSTAQIRELAQQAMLVIPERVAYFAPQLGVNHGRITIRNQRTKWGSCSSKGNLNFNCLLMLMPPEVMDYIVVHELCHRKHMDHSRAFWAEVERILPDYRQQKQWLKEHGNRLIARMTG